MTGKKGQGRLSENQDVAFHEAGHAVAAVELGVRFRDVSIVADESEGSAGHMFSVLPLPFSGDLEADVEERGEEKVRRRYERHLIVSLAGEAAQRIAANQLTGNPERYRGCDNDRNAVYDVAVAIFENNEVAEAYVAFLYRRAVSIMRSPAGWCGVAAVAAALQDKKMLSSAQVRSICREAVMRAIKEDSRPPEKS